MTRFRSTFDDARSSFAPGAAPPSARHEARFVYGLMQPLVGARVLMSSRTLLRAALRPVLIVFVFCAALSIIDVGGRGHHAVVRHFYRTFAVLAPLPSVLLAGLYARLVVKARAHFALAVARPRLESLWVRCKQLVAQAITMSIALLPFYIPLWMIPGVGGVIAKAVAAVWALHWIVVDALDGVRVEREVEGMEGVRAPSPWFVRAVARGGRIKVIGAPLRWLARTCDRMTLPWHEEIAFIESHPWLVLGFALTTAALLAIPVLNLFFRPVVLVGAVHLLASFERASDWVPGSPQGPVPPARPARAPVAAEPAL